MFGTVFGGACVATLVVTLLYFLRPGQASDADAGLPAPEETVTVLEMAVHYRVAAAEAEERFKDKIVQIRGQIESTRKDLSGVPYVTLCANDGGEVFTVRCMFSARELAALEGLHQGDSVIIDGKCRGRATLVLVEECKLR